MRETWIAGVVLAALLSRAPVLGDGPRARGHEYVGVKKCALCHSLPRKGAQYQKWATTKHALAWRVLGTEMTREMAREMGVEDPRKSDRCLRCHTTAHGVQKEQVSDGIRPESGVGCEMCHGPGGDYAAMDVMSNREEAIAHGLVIPEEKLCRGCHNKESPTFRPFDYDARRREIIHPDPTRAKTPRH